MVKELFTLHLTGRVFGLLELSQLNFTLVGLGLLLAFTALLVLLSAFQKG